LITPTLIDSHTHLVFAGSRYDELDLKLRGYSYEEIATKGGGIQSSVKSTRAISENKLFTISKKRIENYLSLGVGILEIKSGYGLDFNSEIKQLSVIKKLKAHFKEKCEIYGTFLGAHAFPSNVKTVKEKNNYCKFITEVMIPFVAENKLADSCDVFFEKGYFDKKQSLQILKTALKNKLSLHVHADELNNNNGAHLAASLKSLSADHLLHTKLEGFKKLKKAGTTAVLLPGTAFYLNLPFVDFDIVRKSGAVFALASDFNPGSCPSYHLPFMMTLGCLKMGMTPAEAMASVTIGAAHALGIQNSQGFVSVGKKTKISIFNLESYKQLVSEFAKTDLCYSIL
jgi:imidazolonepropionase